MIEGVQVHALRQIADERGKVMHMLRADSEHFERFGEIYFSVVYPGAVKAWHLHKEMTLNYACVFGMIKLALYDDREGSPSRGEIQELFLGESNYVLAQIPPGIWNGFKGIGAASAMKIDMTAGLVEDREFEAPKGANGVFSSDSGEPRHYAATRTTVRPFRRIRTISLRTARR